MYKKTISIGCIAAALAVAFGAVGAHLLKKIISPNTADALDIFHTAAQYQMYHAIAIIITGVLLRLNYNKSLQQAAYLFIIGIILFSGSLYALALFKVNHISSLNFLGAITPLGGLCFMAGWLFLLVGARKMKE